MSNYVNTSQRFLFCILYCSVLVKVSIAFSTLKEIRLYEIVVISFMDEIRNIQARVYIFPEVRL